MPDVGMEFHSHVGVECMSYMVSVLVFCRCVLCVLNTMRPEYRTGGDTAGGLRLCELFHVMLVRKKLKVLNAASCTEFSKSVLPLIQQASSVVAD